MVSREVLEPFEVRRAPVGALAEDEPASRQKFEDVVPGLEDLALEGLTAAHDVAHLLVRFARDAHGDEFTGAIEPRQVRGVSLVMLPVDARTLGDERRRDDFAGIAPLRHRPMEDVTRTACLIAGVDLPISGNTGDPLLELREVVGEPVKPRWRLYALGQDRDGDRVLVHIHAEVDDSAGCGSDSTRGRTRGSRRS